MIPGGGRDSLQRLEMMRDAQATVLWLHALVCLCAWPK